ncbi:XtrA/YqaO family protein [Lysinibacillus sp. NPDC056232]|uniref:XtrA/YqaO family protein n=1 Tax=Lysinibacillus sp. NPDC056232 TaxID=3345756 RepID=UPI0035E367B3
MRMKNLEINCDGLLEVDIMKLPENCVIILSGGKAKVSELPAFAETKIVTQQGRVKRVKWDEGEEF